ncbi:MAG TPA: M28 family peptidase, partial [Methylomirabilota bacterium]
LVAALLGETPLVDDLAKLTDRIGGRPTGSAANLAAVEWAFSRLEAAGVAARRERFEMPSRWLPRAASATISGPDVRFSPPVAAMPYSIATGPGGVSGPLVDAGSGTEADFARLGGAVRGAFLLVETEELADIVGLFMEYADAMALEARADAAGAAGVVYMGSRPGSTLYRHNVSAVFRNRRPMLVMDRAGAARALRLLRAGLSLTIEEHIDVETGGRYESENVIAEIRGASRPDEVVLMGAHLDSWDLGTGALDNGANVALLIDVARQIVRLGLRPARSIRFALWNGEEQGIYGSLGYTRTHAAELDEHVVAGSIDIGCGRITGFFTGGRPGLVRLTDRALAPLAGLGPFTQIDAPIVGTDNLDFMLEGVPNLVANQEPAAYGPTYHARTDTLDQCDTRQVRLNAAVVGALIWSFANDEERLPRHARSQVEQLMERTDLDDQLRSMGVWDDWAAGRRGRR